MGGFILKWGHLMGGIGFDGGGGGQKKGRMKGEHPPLHAPSPTKGNPEYVQNEK